jgi:hypothetical protein
MSLPRRRRGRPRGRARLALTGDFPATDHDITEAMEAIPPAPWDGTTISLSDLRGQPRYPHGHFTGIGDETTWHPAPGWAERRGIAPADAAAMLARTHHAAGQGWVMTVDTDAPAIPMDTRLRRARSFIELEVADLAEQGMLYRIDDAEQVRQRGEELDERSLIALTVAKAARHLMGPREPWDLMGPREPWDPS